jgi:hypothetical protein
MEFDVFSGNDYSPVHLQLRAHNGRLTWGIIGTIFIANPCYQRRVLLFQLYLERLTAGNSVIGGCD